MQSCLGKRRLELQHYLLLFAFTLLPLAKSSNTGKFGTSSNNKYHSYLNYPRISFAGKFQANAATGNNIPSNYDINEFFSYDRYGIFQGGKNQWNPDGTNDFVLMDCHVTSTCYIDGKCTESANEDKICGAVIKDSGISPFAKFVDIDPTCQLVPEIWGLRVQIPGFLEGKMRRSPLMRYWPRGIGKSDKGTCGIYQSTITNVRWASNANSSVAIQQMREVMQHVGSSELSIIFTLDMYHLAKGKDFAMGRILGTIGVSGPSASQVHVVGRSLAPVFPLDPDNAEKKDVKKYLYTNHAPFVIDEKKRILHIGFLNSFLTLTNGNLKPLPAGTKIGYFPKSKVVGTLAYPLRSGEESAVVITDVSSLNLTSIMWRFGGVVDIELTEEQSEDLRGLPLSLFRINGSKCNIFMQEFKDGLYVASLEDFVYRLEHGEEIAHKLFVTKFGKPCQNVSVTLTPDDTFLEPTIGIGQKRPHPFRKLVRLSDKNGLVSFAFTTRSSHTFIRLGIDGNVESYIYAIANSSMAARTKSKYDRLIIARVFHNQSYPDEVTWTDHVLPVFKLYANMFPVMRSRGFDMGNYFDVVDHKEILRLSMTIPMSHPSYMPATRDLSKGKKAMILRWLSKKVPPYGDATKLLTKHYLIDLLQTALEVTHASIPLILNAVWSIKTGYNKPNRKILLQILKLEYKKIGIIAKIMSSLGHHPKFFHQEFLLHYPSRLQNGIHKDLILSLEKLSENFIRNNIMVMKRPENNKLNLWFKSTIFKHTDVNLKCHGKLRWRNPLCNNFWSISLLHKNVYKQKCKSAVNTMLTNSLEYMKPEQTYNPYLDPQDRTIFKYRTSVDSLFNHILLVLSFVTNCGSSSTIFHNARARNVWERRHFYKKHAIAYNYFSAVNDIRRIIRVTNSIFHPSQYTLLSAIVEDRYTSSSAMSDDKVPKKVMEEANAMIKDLRSNSRQPHQKPTGVLKHGVWPIVTNAKVVTYPKGKVRNLATQFNDIYTFYLITYEKALKATFLIDKKLYFKNLKELERAFILIGHRLVQTPIRSHGKNHVGPNAAPTFEIDFEIARTKFLENATVIKTLKDADWNVYIHMKLRKKYLKDFAKGGPMPQASPPSRETQRTDAESETKVDDATGDVYQPICKNPFFDLQAIYNNLPIL